MIDQEYSRYVTELLMDQEQTEEVLSRRFDAIQKLRERMVLYEEEGFLLELVETVFRKKADFILKARTKAEIENILKPSVPRYSCGRFNVDNKYHVEEEELILWSKTSLKAPLIPDGYKRYRELFEKYVQTDRADSVA
ncbi:hypothetical protein C808_02534 [Lachnospiraceae bacterium M18-1]|nr:hypothetical protein C808_02534 [Lachnospiraceae bacterium M18-1]